MVPVQMNCPVWRIVQVITRDTGDAFDGWELHFTMTYWQKLTFLYAIKQCHQKNFFSLDASYYCILHRQYCFKKNRFRILITPKNVTHYLIVKIYLPDYKIM